MVVDKPILEIVGCKCISEDVKRILKGAVRSHNAILDVNKSQIRYALGQVKDQKERDHLEDGYAKILLDQELMENLQDFLEDLPTCDEYHHDTSSPLSWRPRTYRGGAVGPSTTTGD